MCSARSRGGYQRKALSANTLIGIISQIFRFYVINYFSISGDYKLKKSIPLTLREGRVFDLAARNTKNYHFSDVAPIQVTSIRRW